MKYLDKIKEIKTEFKNIETTTKGRYIGNAAFKKRVDYATVRNKCKSIDKKTIVYESFYGRGMVCNPYALFLQIFQDERFRDYTHIWVLDNMEYHDNLINKYKDIKNVKFVEIDSLEYFEVISKAKYLVNNSTWKTFYTPKKEQVLINTWHGTALKSMGYDMENGNVEVSNTIRNYLLTDYLIAANPVMTEMYRKAYKMDGIFEGEIIETGYPRNDILFKADKEDVIKKLEAEGVKIEKDKKIVVYAPTWKGESFSNPDINADEYINIVERIYNNVDRAKYQVLFKPHQVVYKSLKEKDQLEDFFIPANIDTNEILSITDILISDYSSIFFDFLCTDRPILFYIPDLESYEENRKLYLRPEELPGPVTKDINEIGHWITDIDNYNQFFNSDNYVKLKEKICGYDDGHVSERIIDKVFFGKESCKVYTDFSTTKKKLLICNDTMKTNGVTSSLLNLLTSLDYDKYDVTLYAGGATQDAKNNLCRVNPNVRAIYKNSTYNTSIEEEIQLKKSLYLGLDRAAYRKLFPREVFEKEMYRNFGKAKFDYIIDFLGYSPFLVYMFTVDKNAKKLVWLHNDMVAERSRFENGERKFKVIASAYPYYDKLVSCAASVNEINYKNLAKPSTKDKFSYAKNMMSKDRIEQSLASDLVVNYENKDYYIQHLSTDEEGKSRISLVDSVDSSFTNFVNVGRLSMEKNQKNLVLAFEKVHKEYPNTRLYILGEGPLKENLRKLVAKLGLVDSVFIPGNIDNPFKFISMCDCFILPSKHEGQPMAILEARILKLPIIVSDFSTVKGSLYENGQYLVSKSVDGIAEGMEAFMEGRVPNEFVFDLDKYNEEALHEFEMNLD